MQEIVSEFLELVQIDAAPKNERAVADAVIAKLKKLGCDTWEDDAGSQIGGNAGNVYAVLEGDKEGSILFTAHLDRVSNGIGVKPRIDGARIVSSGTILAADDISGVVSILDGLRRVRSSGKPHPRIEVIFTVCEEIGIAGSKYLDYSRIQSKLGYVMDTSGLFGRVVRAAPSKASIEFKVSGKNAHAGNAPEKGINAVVVAAKVLAGLKDGRIDFESTANFSTFEAKSPTNVVNDYAFVKGEARSHSADKLDNYIRDFKAVCAQLAKDTGAVIEPSVSHDYPAFALPEDAKSIQLLKKVFDQMSIVMRVEAGGGGMDANRLNAVGIECVGVASGYSKNHSVEEYQEIDVLIRAGEVVERIIMEYAKEL